MSGVAGKDARLNLMELTRRQRNYWDHVLRMHSRQLQRRRLWMRAKEDRMRSSKSIRRFCVEYEQMAQKQAAFSVPRIAARQEVQPKCSPALFFAPGQDRAGSKMFA